MREKVLLFGAGGQLGRLIAASAPEDVLLRPYTSREVDVTSRPDLARVIKQEQPTLMINAAAYTQVDKAEQEPEFAFAVNADAPGHLAELAPTRTRIIHFSTDFVFDGRSGYPYRPDDPTGPLSVYGESKLAGENRLLARQGSTIIIRTAWLYAAQGRNFLNTMLALMATKDELRVVADQIGTPTSAHGLAEVVWRFARQRDTYGIYHWTDQGEASWYDFACEIQRQARAMGLLDREIPIRAISTEEYPTPARRPAYSVLDTTRSWQALDYTGKSWRHALTACLRMARGTGREPIHIK